VSEVKREREFKRESSRERVQERERGQERERESGTSSWTPVGLWDAKLKVFGVAVKVVAGELEEGVGRVVAKTDALVAAFSFLADDHHLDGLLAQLDDRARRQSPATVGEDGHPVLEILSR